MTDLAHRQDVVGGQPAASELDANLEHVATQEETTENPIIPPCVSTPYDDIELNPFTNPALSDAARELCAGCALRETCSPITEIENLDGTVVKINKFNRQNIVAGETAEEYRQRIGGSLGRTGLSIFPDSDPQSPLNNSWVVSQRTTHLSGPRPHRPSQPLL